MGWIIFVVVVLLVLSITRRRTTKARARMSQQMSVLQSQAHQAMQSAQSMPVNNPAGLPVTASRQFAQSMQALQAVLSGKTPTGTAQGFQPGISSMYGPASTPAYRADYPSTYQPGDPATYPPGTPPTYAQPSPVRPRPKVTPLAPQQKRYQGSTAVSGSSLRSTLFTPYQPSSLTTSLSSSLTSSLTDSPPRMGRTAAFGGIEVIPLPDEVAEQVRYHLRNGHEVEAVRLVCDTMNVGLLEATKTVRSYA